VNQNDAQRLRTVLDGFADRLGAAGGGEPAVRELLEFARTFADEDALAALGAEEITAYREAFAPAALAFTLAEERREARALLCRSAGADGTVGQLLGENRWGAYGGMARALELFDSAGWTRLAMVGCGLFPDSLFCLHDRTGVPELHGFDRDPEAVAIAGELVARLGLDRITLDRADAAELDYGAYDAICCSAFAAPRNPILARIAMTAPAGAAVLLREPVSIGTILFEASPTELPDGLEVRARREPAGGPFRLAYVAAVTESRNERSMNPSGIAAT
jgi:hypothetical protein